MDLHIHDFPPRWLTEASSARWGTKPGSRPTAGALIRSMVLSRDLDNGAVERLALWVAKTHRPDRARVTIRRRMGIVPVPGLQDAWCTCCGEPWVCSWLRWAEKETTIP